MEFICKKEYALTPDERTLVGGMIYGGNYTQKQKDVLMGIARRWPERWYRGHKQYYTTIHQVANCPLFYEGSVDAANYFSLTANWAKAYPHVVLALSEAINTAPAPIDWAKEAARLAQMSDKAKAYISASVPADGLFITDFYAPCGDENIEIRCINRGDDIAPELLDVEIEPICHQMTEADWIYLAAQVEKAIAGGNAQ